MPQPVPRRMTHLLLLMFFGVALLALRLHLQSGDASLLALAAAFGTVSLTMGLAVVLSNRITPPARRA